MTAHKGIKTFDTLWFSVYKTIDIEIDGPPTPKSRTICFF